MYHERVVCKKLCRKETAYEFNTPDLHGLDNH